MAKRQKAPYYAALVDMNGQLMRSSFFTSLDEAIAYAERNPGITQIESIGVGIVWDATPLPTLESLTGIGPNDPIDQTGIDAIPQEEC